VASDRFEVRAVTNTSEVLIDRGAADRGFAAVPGPPCQDALECDPACTTVPWHCCHVRERLQVRAAIANRGSAWEQLRVGERAEDSEAWWTRWAWAWA
jgi:hypothetical protein